MKAVHHSIRLPAGLDKTLRKLAEQQGETVYAMLQRSVKAGVAGQTNPSVSSASDRELVAELASVSTRLADVERMLDRTLFTACAACCYARSAATGSDETDDVIADGVSRAYDRQRAIAQEAGS